MQSDLNNEENYHSSGGGPKLIIWNGMPFKLLMASKKVRDSIQKICLLVFTKKGSSHKTTQNPKTLYGKVKRFLLKTALYLYRNC